jgi:Predicted pyridoxal phosphate-dependent enzyme apparently involved in regulation of cell wall biogenesis
MVPFFSLSEQNRFLKKNILDRIGQIIDSSDFCNGNEVKYFEHNLQDYLKIPYVSGVSSGTSALVLALRALGIKSMDEVIVPANTFIATAWAPAYLNAKIIFVDCNQYTANIDVEAVEKKVSSKTRCIIGVHMYGNPFDVTGILRVSNRYGIPMVEDCAQAIGSTYEGRSVGAFGALGCISFYPSKTLGGYGESGAVLTSNIQYYNMVNKLRNHGSSEKYYHNHIGYNMKMDSIQAAILNLKLEYLNKWNNRRVDICRRYRNEIVNSQIEHIKFVEYSCSVNHLFVIKVANRNRFLQYLSEHEIGYGIHYPVPCHLQKAFKNLGYKEGEFPNSEFLAQHIVSLPLFPEMTDEDVEIVIDVINHFS